MEERITLQIQRTSVFLGVEQDEINAILLTEEMGAEEKLTENRRQILNCMSALNNLLSETAEMCWQTGLGVLTGIKSVHNRYEHLKTPAVFSCELKKRFASPPAHPHHDFGLKKMTSAFGLDLTLDPGTAYPCLIISRDRKTVILRTVTPKSL